MSFITLRYLSPNLISVLVITILGVVLAILLLVGAFQVRSFSVPISEHLNRNVSSSALELTSRFFAPDASVSCVSRETY